MRIFLFACGSPNVTIEPSKALITPWFAHPDSTLGDNLAKRWRELGHEVCNYPDAKYDGVNISDYFDAVFLYHLAQAPKWDKLAPDWPYGTKPAACWLHICPATGHAWAPTENVLRKFDYLPSLHSLICEDALKQSPYGHVFELPWPSFSSWEWPPSQPNPYSGKKPVIFFCGRVRPYSFKLFGAIAEQLPDCELHIVSCNIYDPAVRGEAAVVPADLVPLSDLPPGVVYHPPMAHGTFSHFYWYADVALDITACAGQRVANTKLMDYLAAGLPIVADGFAAGMEIAQRIGRIKIAEFGNVNQVVGMLRETLAAGRQEPLRQFSRDYIRAYHSSDRVAETIAGLFENHSPKREIIVNKKTTTKFVFIAGPSAIGKHTLIRKLLDPAEHELRQRLGIQGTVVALDSASSVEDLIVSAEPFDTALVYWQALHDAKIDSLAEACPTVDRRILALWRPLAAHWRIYRDESLGRDGIQNDDAHAADWIGRCDIHRRQAYQKLASHPGIFSEVIDIDAGCETRDGLPDEQPHGAFDVEQRFNPLLRDAIALGIPGTDGAWLPYTSFTLPGFTYDRAYRDTKQRLERFGVDDDLSGLTSLELASHCGAISLELSRRGATALGLEIDPTCVDVANRLAGAFNLPATFQVFDANTDAYPEDAFDVVLCGSLDHWVKERDRLYEAVARLTRKVCYFESNEVTRHAYLDAFFAEQFASVEVLEWSPGNRRLYVLCK